MQSHGCAEPEKGPAPARLLDIREGIKVIETSGSVKDKPYASLSHRWGGRNARRLVSTVRTIRDHMEGLQWPDLPRTFQDGIIIARRMNIEYL